MSRKFLITVILILFLLPFVSWYYLQSGLNWRKQAQQIMSGTQLFPAGEWLDNDGHSFSSSLLAEHVSLISSVTCENLDSMAGLLRSFYHQFQETNKANFIILNSCPEKNFELSDSLKKNWFVFNCPDTTGLCELLSHDWPAGKTFALVDRKMAIRSYYMANTRDEKRILLEHMALLLPRDRTDQVILKRGQQK